MYNKHTGSALDSWLEEDGLPTTKKPINSAKLKLEGKLDSIVVTGCGFRIYLGHIDHMPGYKKETIKYNLNRKEAQWVADRLLKLIDEMQYE